MIKERRQVSGIRIDNGERITGGLYETDTDAFVLTDLSSYLDGFMQAFGAAVDPATVEDVAVKPIFKKETRYIRKYYCPNCRDLLCINEDNCKFFCSSCGQRLDWSESPCDKT